MAVECEDEQDFTHSMMENWLTSNPERQHVLGAALPRTLFSLPFPSGEPRSVGIS